MNIEDLPKLNVYRYETSSGFVIEMPNSVLPVFDAQSASVEWHDFEASSLDFYASPHLEQVFQKWYLDEAARAIVASATERRWFGDEANTIYVNQTISQIFDRVSGSAQFYIGTAVETLVQFSRPCFGKFVNQIIGHNPGQCVLMAGAEYLISASERETTEGTARDHTSHFEFVTLSREHSSPNLFSTAIQKAKRFGWRIWFQLGFSNRVSSFWSRFARLGPLCPNFAIGFGATI